MQWCDWGDINGVKTLVGTPECQCLLKATTKAKKQTHVLMSERVTFFCYSAMYSYVVTISSIVLEVFLFLFPTGLLATGTIFNATLRELIFTVN